MPRYEFDFSEPADGKKLVDIQLAPMNRDKIEKAPTTPQRFEKDVKKTTIWFDPQNRNIAEEVQDILPQGYRTIDRGVKNYFAGMRIPTKDSIKLMQVRLSGGDKPYLIWAQDLKRGRVSLPVMSIKREREEQFLDKFSPAHKHYFTKRFVDQDMTRIALGYRPVPVKVVYSLSAWAEFKRDLEYIAYQVRTRFNPISEFYVEDEYSRMSLIMHYDGMTTATDDEIPPEQQANKRYDFSIWVEGYLPLPEKIVPSILGKVTILKEFDTGDVLQTVEGKLNLAQIDVHKEIP